jgi:hypothetical protein
MSYLPFVMRTQLRSSALAALKLTSTHLRRPTGREVLYSCEEDNKIVIFTKVCKLVSYLRECQLLIKASPLQLVLDKM